MVLVFLSNWILVESPHENHSEVTQQLLQTASLRNVDSEAMQDHSATEIEGPALLCTKEGFYFSRKSRVM